MPINRLAMLAALTCLKLMALTRACSERFVDAMHAGYLKSSLGANFISKYAAKKRIQ